MQSGLKRVTLRKLRRKNKRWSYKTERKITGGSSGAEDRRWKAAGSSGAEDRRRKAAAGAAVRKTGGGKQAEAAVRKAAGRVQPGNDRTENSRE